MFGNLKEKFMCRAKENETRVFTKKEVRLRGLVISILGFLILIPVYALVLYMERLSVFLLVASGACILGGLYIMITGKIPKAKK